MTLAYVFWHTPATDDRAAYEAALAAFHATLSPATVVGFHTSASFAIDAVPWIDGEGYADWYVVDDFAALGELNEAAVRAERRPEHDEAANLAADGVAGVYALRGPDPCLDVDRERWFAKPAGVAYREVFERSAEARALWQRQMVLGPTPEFCAVGLDAGSGEAIEVRRRRVVARSAGGARGR